MIERFSRIFSRYFLVMLAFPVMVFAHGVTQGDQGYIQEVSGINIMPYIYLGAKHMVTGYDHLLFLVGVAFSYIRLGMLVSM